MYDLDKAYSRKFFEQRKSLSWRVPIVVNAILKVLQFKSVIDVGCGNGDLIKGIHDRRGVNCINSEAIKCFGIEGSANALPCFIGDYYTNIDVFLRDIRAPLQGLLIRKADLAICFEVAEHLEHEYADVFVDNLCELSDRILFTAATPGQGGRHHVNCQPFAYWFYKFESRGYRHNGKIVDQLKEHWKPWRHKKGIKAYYNNLMCWERIKP